MTTTIVWFRQDLRLADHAPLRAAAAAGGVVPVFVWAPEEEGAWAPGGASRWWLHRSLAALDAELRARGSRLVLARGPTLDALRAVARASGASAVRWQRRHEPAARARDAALADALRESGLEPHQHGGALLCEPDALASNAGTPFKVFTPFWRALESRVEVPAPRPAPRALAVPARWPDSLPLEALELAPRIAWDAGLVARWTPGEAGALARLAGFADGPIGAYHERRDRPAEAGVSGLAPHLHFGEVSPAQCWAAARNAAGEGAARATGADAFRRQLGWRDFAHHVLWHHPDTPEQPLHAKYAAFPWREDGRADALLRAWQRGRTGYPIVDAGMRELWRTGSMHNRVRMIAASLLVKNLRLHWRHGARWFWDTLCDADLANNTMGWQWVAGCGADAAPYFRIFNPVLQSQRFDAAGAYLRRWLPELARLPEAVLHAPWQAAPAELAAAGVRLGRDYPRPIVDFAQSRAEALAALKRLGGPVRG
jgi:deoxyribodipyrimidine photo-lyase